MTTLQKVGTATEELVFFLHRLAQHLTVCRRKWCESVAEAEVLNNAQTKLHCIDVGGVTFHTQVLDGMLAAMVSFNTFDDEHGYFIDRDPTWFPLMLQFMRTSAVLFPEDSVKRAAMAREAQFYNLDLQQAVFGLVVVRCQQPSQSFPGLFGTQLFQQGSWGPVIPAANRSYDPSQLIFAAENELFAVTLPGIDGYYGHIEKFCPTRNAFLPFCYLNNDDLWHDADRWEDWTYGYHYGHHLYMTSGNCVQSFKVTDNEPSYPRNSEWKTLPPLSITQHRATMCVVGGQLFVIGGGTAAVEEYHAVQEQWVSVQDMPKAVS